MTNVHFGLFIGTLHTDPSSSQLRLEQSRRTHSLLIGQPTAYIRIAWICEITECKILLSTGLLLQCSSHSVGAASDVNDAEQSIWTQISIDAFGQCVFQLFRKFMENQQ